MLPLTEVFPAPEEGTNGGVRWQDLASEELLLTDPDSGGPHFGKGIFSSQERARRPVQSAQFSSSRMGALWRDGRRRRAVFPPALDPPTCEGY